MDKNNDGKVDEEYADLKSINAQQQKFGYYWRFGKMLQWVQEYIIPNYSSGNKVFKQIVIDVNEAANLMAVYPNQFSVDPRVCIVKTEYGDKLNFKEGEKPHFYQYMKDWVDTETVPESPHGKIMNIYVNFDQITSIIAANKNKKGDIDFYSFFSKLLDNINRALGGANNLELVVEEDSNSIKIIDQNPIPGSATEKKSEKNFFNKFIKREDVGETSTMLEIYGYNSIEGGYQSNFVKDFNFETKIDKNYANTLAIAASAGGVSVGEDATAFSKWGYGLVDKYKEQITPPSKDTNATGSGVNPLLIVNEYETYTYTTPAGSVGNSLTGIAYHSATTTTFKSQEFDEKGNIVKNNYFNQENRATTTEKEFAITPEGEKVIENIADRIYNSDLSFFITECFGSDTTGEGVPVIVTENAEDKAKVLENAQSGNSQNTSIEKIKKHGYYTEFNNERILRGQACMKNYLYNMAKQHYKETNSPTGTGGFMPLDLGLTVDGISGIKIFNSINVDTRFLPSAYGDDLDFIVKGVDHKVSNGEWSTQLSALSIPRPTLQIFEIIKNEITITSSVEPANPADAFNEPVLTPINSADNNYIIRMDSGGSGLFGSKRDNGARIHSGLDFLSFEGQETFAPITGFIRKSSPSVKTPKLTGFAIKGTGEYEGVEVKCFYSTTEFRLDLPDSYQDSITVKKAERIGLAQNVLGEGKYNPSTNRSMQNHIHTEFKVNGEVLALQSSVTNFGNLTNWQSKPNVAAKFTIQDPPGIRTEGINELDVARLVKAQLEEFTETYINIILTEKRGNSDTIESEKAVETIIDVMQFIGQDSWDNPELTLRQLIEQKLVGPSGNVDPNIKYIDNKSDLLDLPLRSFVNGFIQMYIYFKNIDPNSKQGKYNTKGINPIGITYPIINPKHPDKDNSRKLVFEYNFQLIFSRIHDTTFFDTPLQDALEAYWMYRGSEEKFSLNDTLNSQFNL